MLNWPTVKEQTVNVLISLATPVVIFLVAKYGLEFATQINIAVGAVIAIVLGLVAYVIAHRPAHNRLPTLIVLAEFLSTVVIACAVCSWVSYYVIYRSWQWRYHAPADTSFNTFFSYYAITFVDMIPKFDVSKTLGIQSNIAPVGIIAGIPVLAFRGFIILRVIASINRWWRQRTATQQLVEPERNQLVSHSQDLKA